MIRALIASALATGLSGCALLNTPAGGEALLKDLQSCERHYNGIVSAGLAPAFSGQVKIDCPVAGRPAAEPAP